MCSDLLSSPVRRRCIHRSIDSGIVPSIYCYEYSSIWESYDYDWQTIYCLNVRSRSKSDLALSHGYDKGHIISKWMKSKNLLDWWTQGTSDPDATK
uniref:Uncharacterized protein n=1 Tax=Oryza punctata TaxID=4537 RepID=A0A0E0M420_ORYPU